LAGSAAVGTVGVTSVVTGVAATSLGKAEDAAHSSGDVGVMMLAVREASATDLSAGNTDGDYEPLQVDASGRLWVNAGAVTPGTSAANLGKAEDAAHSSGDTGVMMLAVREATATDLSAGNSDGDYEPLQVDASGRLWTHAGVIDAGETHVSDPRDVISVTPTVSASSAYTAGDAVGGKQTLTSAARVSGGKPMLESLTIIDKGNQKAALTILFFDADPSAATITDNSAFAWSTDIAKFVGKIDVVTGDYQTIDSKAVATIENLGLILKANGSANLYAAVLTTGTPTYASTSDLIFRYAFLQN